MTSFSPKQTFHRLEKNAAETLKANRESDWLLKGFNYSLAEMAHNGATAEQLAGARLFIRTMQNLWEASVETPSLPSLRLNADNPSQQQTEEKMKEGGTK